jgi:hypothetical protein
MLTTIGAQVFQECPLLDRFVIPASVNSIGTNAFYNSGLNLTFAAGSNIQTIGYAAFWGAFFSEIIIPASVTSFDQYAFYNCRYLTSVTIQTGVITIGNSAFSQCPLLRTIIIPSSVTSINNEAFMACVSLTSVIFSGTSTNTNIGIGSQAFWLCDLTSVTLPIASNTPPNQAAFQNQIRGQTVTFNDFICFHKGITILYLNAELTDEYIPVESLKVGDFVKTYKHGYRRITVMLCYHMRNDSTKFGKSLHRMNKTDIMTADLILTGWHSILVDDLGDYEEETMKRFGEVQIIDGKYLLLCAISRDFTMLEDTDDHSVYHFCLDGDGNETARYGVYANGVLCETPSIAMINKKS